MNLMRIETICAFEITYLTDAQSPCGGTTGLYQNSICALNAHGKHRKTPSGETKELAFGGQVIVSVVYLADILMTWSMYPKIAARERTLPSSKAEATEKVSSKEQWLTTSQNPPGASCSHAHVAP
jgi:hypothetical protein